MPFSKYFNGDQCIVRTAFANGHFWYIDEAMSKRRLWSVGNWNSRFMALSEEEKAKLYVKGLRGEIAYDEYTGGRFHDWIVEFIARKVMAVGFYDKNEMQQIIGEAGISKMDVFCKCPLSLKIKFLISQISPKLFNFLKKTQRKITKK